MVYLISFLELFVEVLCYFYGFIKSFKVSLHLGLLHWDVTMMLERILVWRFMVLCCRNVILMCSCIARRIWNYHRMIFRELISGKCLCDATGIIIWYIVYVGPWVLRWKSLKPSRKTLQCGCMGLVLPLGFRDKDTGLVLPLVWVPKDTEYDLTLGDVPE